MSRPPVLVATVVALVALAGCTSDRGTPSPDESPSASASTAPSSSPTRPPPPPPPPKVGACYALTVGQAASLSSAADPVSCAKRHTARTVHVGRLTQLVDADEVSVNDPALPRRLAATCPQRVDAFLGGDVVTRNLSRFVAIWFVPTQAESEAGASWFRCDVVAFGDGDRFLPLPQRRLAGVLAQPTALDTFGTCGTAAPGSPSFKRVACTLPHSWRALTTLRIADSARYPGAAKAKQAGDQECASLVEDQAGFTTEVNYGWEWPTEQQWESGQRFGFCWAPV